MTELVARSGVWLLQQAATMSDTVVMKTVAVERGWFETVTGIASGVMTLTLLGLTIFLAPAAWSFWRTFRKVRELLDRVYADVTPLTRHASNIADNLDYITTSIRTDVQQVNATIATANRRLNEAVELTETRLNEFNALLQVVQQEAEHAFVSTAAAVRGVKTGAATLGGLVDDVEDELIEGDLDDGDDSESYEDEIGTQRRDGGSVARGAPARPRLRSRRQRRE
ncbi:MAG TPA: DUF948 domain-containing protein [Gemmatimonadaceae bacterium]|nr:DUF948 domain-containing protein [Gemmatimonadaceae bacterium]